MENNSIVILEELSDQNYILKCARCNGKGEISRHRPGYLPLDTCLFCNGRGKVLVKLNGSLPFVKCAVCEGSGKMSAGHLDSGPGGICSACLGLGVQPITGSVKLIR